MADLGYATRTPRASNRALAAKHTEACAKQERIPFQYYRDEKPVFASGDTVKVIDDESIHCGRVGHVSKHLGGTKYSVRFDWSKSAILPFHKSQLAKVAPKVKTPRKRKSTMVKRDTFSCVWGSCDLSKHPDIPKRWAARNIPTGAVILLASTVDPTSPVSVSETPTSPLKTSDHPRLLTERQQIAHEKFVRFMERLDSNQPLREAKLTTRTWHALIERRLEARKAA